MSAPILSTKLSVPPLRPHLVDRPQLFERLDAGLRLGRQLTLIAAMAGSGKTTLASAWLQRIDRPVGWLALDRDDNDPVRFATQLIDVLQRIDSGIGQAARSILEAQHPPAPEVLTAVLINDIAATSTTFVLALDDFHVIQAPAVYSMIAFLLDHQPLQLHVVLLTREDPPLPLPRLRARGQMTELRTEDLRFTSAEIARFLGQIHGLTLDAELLAVLEARTEGWIAGVQLAALALQERDDPAEYIQAFSGSHRYVIDYLAEDVLQRLPDDLRAFLRQTAILDRLTAPLCDAVTGRTDSADCLARLQQANLFIIPLDERREWYRYHPLFAEFLCSALRTEEHPALHRRAAQWYRAHGFLEEAVGQALASNDRELAADLIAQAAGRAIQQGQLTTLLGWLSALPDAQVRTNADLATYKGWILWLIGQADAAASYAQSAEACLELDAPPATRGRLHGLRASLADPDAGSLRLFQEALTILGDTDPLFRNLVLLHVAYTQLVYYDAAEMIHIFHALAELGESGGGQLVAAVALSRLAMALHIHGKRRQALGICQQAIERFVDGHGRPLPVAALVYIMAGRLAYAANDLARAAQQLETGLNLARRLGLAMAIAEGQEALARLQFARGQPTAALATIADARAFAAQMLVRGFADHLAAIETEFQLRLGDRAAAERWAETVGQVWAAPSPATSALPLTYGSYSRWLLAQRRPQEALVVLASVERWARAGERYGHLVHIHILQALAYRELCDIRQALACLSAAVDMAAPEDERRVFLDQGRAVMELLPGARSAAPVFVDGLLAAFQGESNPVEAAQPLTQVVQPATAPAEPVSLLEPLSQREGEILRLVETGLPNEAVAQMLVIASGTVKKHLDNIYGKLGVHNRTEAVARARQLDLL